MAALYIGRDTLGQTMPRPASRAHELWIDQFEVTNAQYAEFLAETGDNLPKWAEGTIPLAKSSTQSKGNLGPGCCLL
jgi:formylglycine-generating enzyme required for sulfatase activity